LIDAEGDDVVGELVGGEDVACRGIEGEVAGGVAARGCMADWGEFTCLLVDAECGDAVVAAVGSVEEFAGGVDADFGGGVVSVEVVGQGGDGLDFCECSGLGIAFEGGDGGEEFVDDVGEWGLGVDGEVSGAGTWRDCGEGGSVWNEVSFV